MIDLYKIVTEAQELEDEFIFTTIQPFCEDVIKRKISKAELVKLLSQPKIVRCGECKYMTPSGMCDEFADSGIRPSASDFCSYGERRADVPDTNVGERRADDE